MVEIEKDHDAFREGLFVRALGRPLSSNPYPPESADGRLWAEGWRMIEMRRDNTTRYAPPMVAKSVTETLAAEPADAKAARRRKLSFRDYVAIFIAIANLILLVAMIIAKIDS